MKKCLLYLLTVLCVSSLLVSCSDDDDNKSGWENVSGTYDSTCTLSIHLDDATLPLGNKTVEVSASSADQVVLTLYNVVPETSTLQVTASSQQTGDVLSLSGESATTDGSVQVTGTFEKGKLSLVVHRQITSDVAGQWKVKMTAAGAGVYANLVTGNPQLDALSAMAGPLVGGLIAQKVEYVYSDLQANGVMGVAWKSRASDQPVDLSMFTNALSLQYCVRDGQLLIAIDKAYTDLLALADSKLSEFGLSAEMLTSSLIDLGGYYALPMGYQMNNGDATFYLTKEVLVPTMQMAMPLLMNKIPEAYQGLVSGLLPALQNAESLDFGLVFEKR